MKVLLINEPFIPDFCRTQRWAARTRGRVIRPPDWLAYATAVLEKEGIDAELWDFCAMGWGKERLRYLVAEKRPDLVVLDSTTPSIYSDLECAGIVKGAWPARVVLVGPHASALPEETLLAAGGAVDFIAIGEYDYTIRDLCRSLDAPQNVAGICYLEGGRPVRSAPRPFIEDLDALPFPAWHQLDLMRYFDGLKLHPFIDVIGGRGCPNRCAFCLWPQVMHGTRYRLRSPQNILDEIESDIEICPPVVKTGEFFFEDDTFTADRRRAAAICQEILKRGLRITFSINCRADLDDPELFRLLKAAGCRELLVGFESGDEDMLKRMNKNLTLDQSRHFMSLAKRHRLAVHGCFVLGMPGETEESMQRTVDFALSLGLDSVQFSAAVPFPGTQLYEMCRRQGLLEGRDWDSWLGRGEQRSVFTPTGLAPSAVDACADAALRRFYFRPGYMLAFLFRSRNMADVRRKMRGARNFLRYLRETRRAG